jgi:Domain of unknown function (DUF1707)
MAGPRDGIAAAAGRGRGELRAFVQGMLAKDEFDQRVGQAFAARTHAKLTALTADLWP